MAGTGISARAVDGEIGAWATTTLSELSGKRLLRALWSSLSVSAFNAPPNAGVAGNQR